MNYHGPRQMMDADGNPTGRWNYTTRNDDRIWTHASCRDHSEEGHGSEEEARACAARWELATARFDSTFGDWTGCGHPDCDVPTKAGAQHGIGMAGYTPLCAEHLTPEGLAACLPPLAGDVMSS